LICRPKCVKLPFMNKLALSAQERTVLGKKVKQLRKDGLLPGHVFGKGIETEHVSVPIKEFLAIFHSAGETGLIDLRIGQEKNRPVLVRDVQYDPVRGQPLHVDFYQVNLKEKVIVPVPIVLIGEEHEAVKLGEVVVLQNLNEVNVEALPTDLVENIEVDITPLKAIDDAITIGQLNYDRSKLTLHAPEEEIVVKLAPAVTAEMEKLLEEEAAETADVQAEATTEEGVTAEVPTEGAESTEDTATAEGDTDARTEGEAEKSEK